MTESQQKLWEAYQPLLKATIRRTREKLKSNGFAVDEDDIESEVYYKMFKAITRIKPKRDVIEAYLSEVMRNCTKESLRKERRKVRTQKLKDNLEAVDLDPEKFIRDSECPENLVKFVRRILYSRGRIKDITQSNNLRKWYEKIKPELTSWLEDLHCG